jgi:serine/threonine protein kinase/WD40 repeat protein
MSAASPNQHCERCGRGLDAFAADGICPNCLLNLAFTDDLDETREALLSGDHDSGDQDGFILGDFHFEHCIAQGGMGIVYRARQLSLDRTVAVKMLLYGAQSDRALVERFKIEAKSIAKLRHPNIVTVHEVGELDGQPYFSMDFIHGSSLAEKLRDMPVSDRQAGTWAFSMAEAIQYAHTSQVLHRDIKPSNILIDPQGKVHVTDFGLAKEMDRQSDLTLTGQILGTPNYLAPEYASGAGEMSIAMDIYAIGAVMYEMVVGHPPFMADSIQETLIQIRDREVIEPRKLNPNIDPDYETICLKCLEKHPDRRYRTAQDLADDLNRFLNHFPILAKPAGKTEKIMRWSRRRPQIAALSLSLTLSLLLGIGGMVWQLGRVSQANSLQKRQVAQLNVISGARPLAEKDYFEALLWFVNAMKVDQMDAKLEQIHRTRIAMTLDSCPRLAKVVTHKGRPISSAAFSPVDDRLATLGADHRLMVWDFQEDQLVFEKELGSEVANYVCFSPDGSVLLIGYFTGSGFFSVVDAQNGSVISQKVPHLYTSVYDIFGLSAFGWFHPVFAPEGKWVLTQPSKDVLQLVSLENVSVRGPEIKCDQPMLCAGFGTSEHTIWAQTYEGVQIFDRDSSACLSRYSFAPGELNGFGMAGDGIVGFGGHEMFYFKDPLERFYFKFPDRVEKSVFSRRGDRLITAGYGLNMDVWNVSDRKIIVSTPAHQKTIHHARFSPDERRAFTATEAGLARVWDLDSGELIAPPLPHDTEYGPPGFSGSGRYFMTMHPQRALYVWDLFNESRPPVQLRPFSETDSSSRRGSREAYRDPENPELIHLVDTKLQCDQIINPSVFAAWPRHYWLDRSGDYLISEMGLGRAQVFDTWTGTPVTPIFQTKHTQDSDATQTVHLDLEELPVEQIQRIIELMSGRKMLTNGGWEMLPLRRLYMEWQDLSTSQARWIGVLPSKQIDWHRQQLGIAQRVRDWNSAEFHLLQLDQLQPEDEGIQQERRYVQSAREHAEAERTGYIHQRFVRPPRNPKTPREQIDLSSFYTGSNRYLERVDGRGLPAGSQVLNGVHFDIRGEIVLNGRGENDKPRLISGIPIDLHGRVIHLLHQSSLAYDLSNGEVIAKVRVHYENGVSESFSILRLIHIQDDWETVDLSEADVAALMITTAGDPMRINRRIYHMTWANPHPEWKIVRLDVEMEGIPVDYRLHAITIETP